MKCFADVFEPSEILPLVSSETGVTVAQVHRARRSHRSSRRGSGALFVREIAGAILHHEFHLPAGQIGIELGCARNTAQRDLEDPIVVDSAFGRDLFERVRSALAYEAFSRIEQEDSERVTRQVADPKVPSPDLKRAILDVMRFERGGRREREQEHEDDIAKSEEVAA